MNSTNAVTLIMTIKAATDKNKAMLISNVVYPAARNDANGVACSHTIPTRQGQRREAFEGSLYSSRQRSEAQLDTRGDVREVLP